MPWDSSVTVRQSNDAVGGLVVQLGGDRRLIPIATVIEVLREARIIRVPGGVPAVRGMVNHRGRILTVADGQRALGLAGDAASATEVVVVQWENHRFGLAVDSVVELLNEARTGLAEIDLERVAAAIFA